MHQDNNTEAFITTRNLILAILSEHNALSFKEILEQARGRDPAQVTESTYRYHLSKLVKTGEVQKTAGYQHRRGFHYYLTSKPTPVGNSTLAEVQFGYDSAHPGEMISALHSSKESRILNQHEWNKLRYGFIGLLLANHPQSDFDTEAYRAYVTDLRERLLKGLAVTNSILQSDLFSSLRRSYLLSAVDPDYATNAVNVVNEFQSTGAVNDG